MILRVSASGESEPAADAAANSAGVLAKLPRTRPQRSSPRRAAARKTAGATTGGARSDASADDRAATQPSRREDAPASRSRRAAGATPKRPARGGGAKPGAQEREAVPRQGFESDTERARGPVQPPGGADFVATAVEIVGELARAGAGAGERLVKDLLSRLPLS